MSLVPLACADIEALRGCLGTFFNDSYHSQSYCGLVAVRRLTQDESKMPRPLAEHGPALYKSSELQQAEL